MYSRTRSKVKTDKTKIVVNSETIHGMWRLWASRPETKIDTHFLSTPARVGDTVLYFMYLPIAFSRLKLQFSASIFNAREIFSSYHIASHRIVWYGIHRW